MMDFVYRLNRNVRRMFARAGEGLSNMGAAIVRPIEWLFAATFGRLFHALEGFDRVDQWLLGLLRFLTWPVRMAWRLFVAIASAVLPKSLFNAFAAVGRSWSRFWHGAGSAAWTLVERLNLDGLMLWLAWLTKPVWRPIAAVGGFLYAWIATRPYKQMLWGLPVLVLLLPIAGAVAWGVTLGRENVEAQYRAAVKEAREAKDFERAQLYEQKLDQLGVDTRNADFKSAVALGDDGKLDEAFAMMQTLAPEKTPGYLPAHHWILIRLLGNELNVPNDERLRLAGVHLEHLKSLGIKGADLDLLEAIWLAQTGKLQEASTKLEPLITRIQLAALQRFEIDLKLNNLEESRRDARALVTHFEEAQRRNLKFQSNQYMAWAQAEQLLGNVAEWGRVVREWLVIDPNNPFARQSVATLDLMEFNDIIKSPLPDAGELTERLIEIAKLTDKPAELEPQVAVLYRVRRQSPAITELIEKLIATPDLPLPLMGALGTAAALDGDVAVARNLLERAVAADPKNAVMLNNLAWAMSQDPNKDFEKALAAVNRALELTPSEFRFRETRGQILVSLGRWQEAVDDLEFALNGMPDAAPIHIALATAYEKLGQAELATIHRQQAK